SFGALDFPLHGLSVHYVGTYVQEANPGLGETLEILRQLLVRLGSGSPQQDQAESGLPRKRQGAFGCDPLTAACDENDVCRAKWQRWKGMPWREKSQARLESPSGLVVVAFVIPLRSESLFEKPCGGVRVLLRDVGYADSHLRAFKVQGAGE